MLSVQIGSQTNAAQQVSSFEEGRGKGEIYTRVIVTRVNGSAALRAGDRFIVRENGEMIGFSGGGCVRSAVQRAGKSAIKSGQAGFLRAVPNAKLQSLSPEVGIDLAVNNCASEGEIDFFIEPILPRLPLVIFGQSLLANSVAELGKFAGFAVTQHSSDAEFSNEVRAGYCIVATQGTGDKSSLITALNSQTEAVLFVASQKKTAKIKASLDGEVEKDRLEKIISPAGLNIGAVGPAEIAVSIIAQLISLHRQGDGGVL